MCRLHKNLTVIHIVAHFYCFFKHRMQMLRLCYAIFFEVKLCWHSWLHSNENYLPCAGKYICICFLPQHSYSHAALAHCIPIFFSRVSTGSEFQAWEREKEMQCEQPEVQFNISSVNWQTCLEGVHSMNQHCKQLPYGRISASETAWQARLKGTECAHKLYMFCFFFKVLNLDLFSQLMQDVSTSGFKKWAAMHSGYDGDSIFTFLCSLQRLKGTHLGHSPDLAC